MNKLHNIINALVLEVLVITSISFAAHDIKIYVSIPDDSSNGINVTSTSSGNYGITSYDFISEDKIALLCSSERKIKVFNTSTNNIITCLKTNFFPEDFIFYNNNYFVLSDYSIHQLNYSGSQLNEFKINNEFRFIDRMTAIDSSLYILTSDEYSYKVIDNGYIIPPEQQLLNRITGWVVKKDTSVNIIKSNDYEFLLSIFSKGIKLKEKTIRVNEKLGSAVVVGSAGDIIYIDVSCIINEIPLKTHREIFAYSLSSYSIIDTIEVPENYHYYSKRDLTIHNNSLYKLFSLEDKTEVAELKYNQECRKTIFPGKYYIEYHYNNHLPESHELRSQQSLEKSSNVQSITRSQVLENADKYEKVQWYCSDKNTSNYTIVYLPDGGIIRTPEWVVVGDKVKMPYKWGGFTLIDDFVTRINAGAYAGDDYTSREQNVVSAGDTYCVGVDCSGFVSRVWGRTTREWTGSLPNISTQLQSWSEIQPSDIANKAGSHTMLFVSVNPSGTFNIIHASGHDWRVSYMTISLTDLTGYVPLKYNNIEEVTSIASENLLSNDFELFQNYPNPFNPVTTIRYQIPAALNPSFPETSRHVTLKVYNILGCEIAGLLNSEQKAGQYEVKFDGNSLPSGIYFIELNVDNIKKIKKMLLLR